MTLLKRWTLNAVCEDYYNIFGVCKLLLYLLDGTQQPHATAKKAQSDLNGEWFRVFLWGGVCVCVCVCVRVRVRTHT